MTVKQARPRLNVLEDRVLLSSGLPGDIIALSSQTYDVVVLLRHVRLQ